MKIQKMLLAAAVAGIVGYAGSAKASLVGAIYLDGSDQSVNSVATALSHVSGTPTATFLSSDINSAGYSGHDGSTIPQVLSSIGDSAITDTSAGAPVGTFIMDLNGYLQVTQSGTYTFADNNDDGGAFFINGTGTPGSGTELAENDGLHGQQYQSSPFTLTAYQLYKIEYVAYNGACFGCGYNGLAGPTGGGLNFVAQVTGPGTVTALVPEPVSAGLLAVGALGILRRRRQA